MADDGGSIVMFILGLTIIFVGVMLIPIFIGIPIMLAGVWMIYGAFKG